MGRYLDGWEDAQTRGSSRNGGRGGENLKTDSSYTAEDIGKYCMFGFHFPCVVIQGLVMQHLTSTENTAIALKMVHIDSKASQVTA